MELAIISARRLAWIARCERRLWLDCHGDPAAQVDLTPEAQARAEMGQDHEAAMVETITRAKVIPDGPWEQQHTTTLALMQQGTEAIRHAALDAPLGPRLLRSTIDLLLRQDRPSRLGKWSYLPVAIKLHSEPRREDWLQLDAYCFLVRAVQGRETAGELWLGREGRNPRRRLINSGRLDSFTLAWQRLEALTKEPQAPMIWFERSCIFCPWRMACQETALTTHDLALLPGLQRRSAQALHQAGLTTLAQVAAEPPGQVRAITMTGERQADMLQWRAQALVKGQVVALPIPKPLALVQSAGDPALFIDIEIDPLTRQPWAIGWAQEGGAAGIALVEAKHARARHVPLPVEGLTWVVVESLADAWRTLAKAATGDGPLVHWGDVERTLLKRTAPSEVRATLLPRFQDAHRILTGHYALPLPRTPTQQGGSLKTVGAWLGVEWPQGSNSWQAAWHAFRAWLEDDAPSTALVPIAHYLGTDLRALARSWAWLREAWIAETSLLPLQPRDGQQPHSPDELLHLIPTQQALTFEPQ